MSLQSDIISGLKRGITNYAKKFNQPKNNIRILIYNKDADINKIYPQYGVLNNMQFMEEATFGRVLDIVFDKYQFLGGSKNLATPYISEFMQKKCKEFNISPNEIRLHISTNDDAQTLQAWLYRNDMFVKELTLEEILGR